VPQVAASYKQNSQAGLDIMVVLGENQTEGKPSIGYCQAYAQQHGVPLNKIFIDHGNTYGGWETLFGYINPYIGSDGMFALPWEAVLDGDNMEYIFASSAGPYNSAVEAINQALAD